MDEFGELTNLSESEHDEEAENQPPVKKQKVFCEYVHVQDSDTLVLAKKHILERKRYNYWVKPEFITGTKSYYKCKPQTCTLKTLLEFKAIV